MILKRATLIALVIIAVSLTAASSVVTQTRDEVREEFHQTYPLTPDGRISLENMNGSVRITAWDRQEVKVDAVKRAQTR
ncbi:MAG TPA: hypothetical protein VD966_08375 [Pyrinomonadaceae bacterium]|nr:hypothetical protein [Pyrinomonadaceae bacterium]